MGICGYAKCVYVGMQSVYMKVCKVCICSYAKCVYMYVGVTACMKCT